MNVLHMEIEIVRDSVRRLREALKGLHEVLWMLESIPSVPQWWQGGNAQDFDQDLQDLRFRLWLLTEEEEHLVGLLQHELHEWEAADAHFGDIGLWERIEGFLSRIGQGLITGFTALYLTLADWFNRLVGWVFDPVDIRVGYYVYEHDDLVLPPGAPFVLRRVYISHPADTGWRFNFPTRMIFPETNRAQILLGSGGDLVLDFVLREDGHWQSPRPGYRLESISEGYRLFLPQGEVLTFDRDGRWRTWQNAVGQRVHLEWPDEHTWHIRAPWGALWAEGHLDEQGRLHQVTDEHGGTLHYQYDASGRLIAFTDRDGHTTRYEYTDQGQLARIIGPDGRVLLENFYDERGRVVRQRDPAGQEMRFAYEEVAETGQLRRVTVTYPDGTQVRYILQNGEVVGQQLDEDAVVYRRDARGFLVEVQDPHGKVWRLDWDDAGRLTGVTDPAGHAFRVTYDQRGALLTAEGPNGVRLEVEYDAQGRPTHWRGPERAEFRLEYDDYGRLVGWVDPLGHRMTFAYDEQGRLTEMRLPDGATYTYQHESHRVVETDPVGRTGVYEFDGEDRLLAVRRNGRTLQLNYTPDGKLVALEDGQGRRIQAEYDPRGLPVAFRFPNGLELRQAYDALGRPVELRTAQGQTLFERTYDKRGRLIALTDARGHSWRYAYDKAGNLIALTDRKGRTYRFEYDEAYRPVRIYDSQGRRQAQIEYDEVGHPRRLTDAEGHTLAFTFDALGRLVATTWDEAEARAELDPAGRLVRLTDEKGRVRTYTYDPRGNLIRETYPLNQTYTYAYDPGGRLTRQTLPDGTQVEFAYDDLDRLVALTHRQNGRSATVQYAYGRDDRSLIIRDAAGEVHYTLNENEGYLERRDVFGQTVRYEFTPEGRVRRLVYPDARAVEYEYDANGNLTRIRDFAGHETLIKYDEQDLPVRVEHPGGLVSLYAYDSQDRVVRIRHLDAQGNLLVEQRLQRDATGRVVDVQVFGPVVEKLTRVPDERSRRTFTFNDLDQIIATDEGPFRYDRRGNLVEYVDAGRPARLRYDLRDRLVEAHLGDDRFRYAYDPEGNRVAVTHNGRTRRYILDTVWDLPRPLVEIDEAGQVQQYFIWGMGLHYALDAEGNPLVYLFNHRGDTLAVVDGTGRVVAAYDYAPYGQVVGRYGEDVPFRFLGRWGIMADHDGLYYIRARYYAPRLGFFTQPDRLHVHIPLPRFLNRYAYALDDLWNLVDVDGQWLNVLAGAIVGGILGGTVELGMQTIANAAKHGLDFSSYTWDGAAIAGAAVGGAVSGALMSSGVGVIPIVGAAFAGGVGNVADQLTQNFIKDAPLAQGLGGAFLTGSITGGIMDAAPLLLRAGRSGAMAALHGHNALGAAWRASTRWWTQEVAKRQAERQVLSALEKRMGNAFWKSIEHNMGILSTAAAPFKAFWRGGIRDRIFIHSIMRPLADLGEWRDEIKEKVVEKMVDKHIEG